MCLSIPLQIKHRDSTEMIQPAKLILPHVKEHACLTNRNKITQSSFSCFSGKRKMQTTPSSTRVMKCVCVCVSEKEATQSSGAP